MATRHWYRRAGKPVCGESLDADWLNILKGLLGIECFCETHPYGKRDQL